MLRYLRFIIACEVAGDWAKFGALGEVYTNFAHIVELSVVQNMETDSRFGEAQSADWPHLAREGGYVDIIREESAKLSRERLSQSVNDQRSEFSDRARGQSSGSSRQWAINPKRDRKSADWRFSPDTRDSGREAQLQQGSRPRETQGLRNKPFARV